MDYYHPKVNVWVASRVAEQLVTYDLRKLWISTKVLNMLGTTKGEGSTEHQKWNFW